MNTNKKPDSATMARIKAVFSTLQPGDLIQGGNMSSVVVIRLIDGKGAVLGVICESCGNHVTSIVDTTYSWSDEKEALVDHQGNVPSAWSYDLQVHRDDLLGKKIAKKYANVPVFADYKGPTSLSVAVDTAISNNEGCLTNGASVLAFGNDLLSMKVALEIAGIQATEEQALLLAAMVIGAQKMKEESILGGVLLGVVRMSANDQQSKGATH